MIHTGTHLGTCNSVIVGDVVPCKPKRRRSYERLEDQLSQNIEVEVDSDNMMLLEPEDDDTMDSQDQDSPTEILPTHRQHQQRSQHPSKVGHGSSSPQLSRFDTIFSMSPHTSVEAVPPLPQHRKPSSNNLVVLDTGQQNDDNGMWNNVKTVRKAWSCPNDLNRMRTRRVSSAGSFSSFLPTITEFQKTSFENHPVQKLTCRVGKKQGRALSLSSSRKGKRSMRHSVSLPSHGRQFYSEATNFGSNHNQAFEQHHDQECTSDASSLPFPSIDKSFVL
jgi:hypothetical protein